jgi:cold shock CspA family protein
MRYQGRLSGWNDDKGFGFVVPNGSGDRAFVHIKAFPRASRRPIDGDLITYATTRDARGRLQANAIRFVGEAMPVQDRANLGWFGPVFALLFVATLIGTVFTGQLPMNVLLAYARVSAVTFIAYGLDKSAATAGRQRTPESTLHFLGFICG